MQTVAAVVWRRAATDARIESALLGVRLTLLYVVGILVGAVGHGTIPTAEALRD